MKRYPNRGLHGRIVEDLGVRIVRGDLQVKDSIDIDELAASHDSSRGVVREALRVLSAKGMIDARPRRGTFVTPRTAWNLLDLDVLRWQFEAAPSAALLERVAQVRVMIEPGAAALAALSATEDDLARIDAALARLETASQSGGPEAVEADVEFHVAIVRATRNELAAQLAGIIEFGLRGRDEFVSANRVSFAASIPQHAAVAAAIRAKDVKAANERMLDLLLAAAQDAERAAAEHGS